MSSTLQTNSIVIAIWFMHDPRSLEFQHVSCFVCSTYHAPALSTYVSRFAVEPVRIHAMQHEFTCSIAFASAIMTCTRLITHSVHSYVYVIYLHPCRFCIHFVREAVHDYCGGITATSYETTDGPSALLEACCIISACCRWCIIYSLTPC